MTTDCHQVIYDACPIPTAVGMVAQVKKLLRKYSSRTILIPGRDVSSYKEHLAIYEAIRKRDAEEAGLRMQAHIGNLKKTFNENAQLLL